MSLSLSGVFLPNLLLKPLSKQQLRGNDRSCYRDRITSLSVNYFQPVGCSQGWFVSYLLFQVKWLVQFPGSSLSCPFPDLVLKFPERLHNPAWKSLFVTMQDSGTRFLWMTDEGLRWITSCWLGSKVGSGSKLLFGGVTDCSVETSEQKSVWIYRARQQQTSAVTANNTVNVLKSS